MEPGRALRRLPDRVPRHRTAIRRTALSRPLQCARDHGLLHLETSLFDYGCGHGDDIARLRLLGIQASGWDPVYRPEEPKRPAEVVNLGFVVNVIETPEERAMVLRDAWRLAEGVLVVAARLASEARGLPVAPQADGGLTGSGTFQKFFDQEELRNWIDRIMRARSVPAAPGIFYVFRDAGARERFLSSRLFRRRTFSRPGRFESHELFERHRLAFEEVMSFLGARGRFPVEEELSTSSDLLAACGSLRRAYAVLRQVTGGQHWDAVRQARSEDFLVYVALSRFGSRPRFGQLPRDLRLDLRAFFGSYRRACEQADALLFSLGSDDERRAACRETPVGKLTPTALYAHQSALAHLPPALRIYEGCARVLIGEVDFANVVKLHHREARISYLEYPDFDRDPHPALARALVVDLQARQERFRDYRAQANPPILHRKEEFVTEDHPTRTKFARLTRREERAGLFEQTERIGTREGWRVALAEAGRELRGHRLVRVR